MKTSSDALSVRPGAAEESKSSSLHSSRRRKSWAGTASSSSMPSVGRANTSHNQQRSGNPPRLSQKKLATPSRHSRHQSAPEEGKSSPSQGVKLPTISSKGVTASAAEKCTPKHSTHVAPEKSNSTRQAGGHSSRKSNTGRAKTSPNMATSRRAIPQISIAAGNDDAMLTESVVTLVDEETQVSGNAAFTDASRHSVAATSSGGSRRSFLEELAAPRSPPKRLEGKQTWRSPKKTLPRKLVRTDT